MRTLLAVVVTAAASSNVLACPPELPPSLTLMASTTGTTLHLTFTNVSTEPIDMPIRVHAGELHYDWLTIDVFEPVYALPDEEHDDRQALRTLTFVEERTKAGVQTVRIAPAGSHLETIDLARWLAKQPPLWAGPYELRIRWRSTSDQPWVEPLYTETALYLDAPPPPRQLACGLALAEPARVADRARGGRTASVALALGLLVVLGVLARRLGNGPGAVGRGVPH
jgi:hypothetical protein